MIKFLKHLDLIVILGISFYCIFINIISFFGIPLAFVEELKIDFSELAVLLLALIGIHLVITYISQEKIDENLNIGIEQIITSLDGVEIRTFDKMQDLEKYLANRIKEAKFEVCDLTWKVKVSLGFETEPRKSANKQIDVNVTRISNKIIYKEVFVFNDNSRIQKLKKRIKENKAGYSCRYYDTKSTIPRIQFVIIDNEEIIFASSSYPQKCAIKHKALCDIFQEYFKQIWEGAIPIKERTIVYKEVYEKIIKDSENNENEIEL